MKNNQIDFIGIGVQKSATSWLYKNLNQHQNIWMPPRKELHYFDRDLAYPSPSFLASDKLYSRLTSNSLHNKIFRQKVKIEFIASIKKQNIEDILWYSRYFFSNYSDKWYLSLFKYKNNIKTGEITPSYSILKKEDIKHIKKIIPDLKIILILRNPIERAWSHIRFHIKLNKLSNHASIENIKKFIDSPKQELRGDYMRTISNWSTFFSREKIHICFHDEVTQNPDKFMTDIFNFLNVDKNSFNKTLLKQKFNTSEKKAMPEEIRLYLAKKYYSDIIEINANLGSYTKQWLSDTDTILNQ